MEDSVGQHKSPLEIQRHSHYQTYNIWQLCEKVSTTYRQEVGHGRWIVERIPSAEGNLGSVSTQKNPNGKFCWDCGSFFHLCNSSHCPCFGTSDQGKHEFKSSRSAGGGGHDKTKPGPGASSEDKDKKERRPMAPWRLVHPKDENATCEVAGQIYKFCALCTYRQTGQVGFFTTGPRMHSTSDHGKHRAAADASAATDSGSSSPGSEGNLGEVLPATDAALDPSDPNGMYAGAFTAQALGFLAEVVDAEDDTPAIIQNASSKDAVEKQMAEWDDVDDEMMFETWDMSGTAFMAQTTAGHESSIPASKGAYVRILNSVQISTGKKENLYGMIISPPKSGGLFYKLSVYDRGLQCFREIRRCRDKFVVVGSNMELPPLLTAWKPTDASGQLLAVGLGNDLSTGVHLEYLFSSRECPVATESQYTLLAQIRQHLVTYPPVIAREDVPAGYLDDDTAVSSIPEFETSEELDSTVDITDKVNALSLYSCCLSSDSDHFFDAEEQAPADEDDVEDTFHDALEQIECDANTSNNNFNFTPQLWFLEEIMPVFTCLTAPLQLAYAFACRLTWFLSAVLWDSLECLASGWLSSQSSPVKVSSFSLRRYPRAWMLLSCLQLTHNAPRLFGYTPPVDRHLLQPLQETWHRQTSLSTFLDPDPVFLLHFHCHRGAHLVSLFVPPVEQEEDQLMTMPLSEYIEPLDFFFDAVSDIDSAETFFDADGGILPFFSPWDFNLSSLDKYLVVDGRDFGSSHDVGAPSPLACTAGLLGNVDLFPQNIGEAFPIVFDTGASLAISPCKDDFVPGSIVKLHNRYLGGLANGLPIEGEGTVQWTFKTGGDRDVILRIRCYYVPNAKARLLSPQRIFSKQRGIHGKYVLEEDISVLQIEGLPDLFINYSPESHLPVCMARNFGNAPEANLGILSEDNRNLTQPQKDFLRWHYRFGHIGMQKLKHLLCCLPFSKLEKFRPLAKCAPCRCEICQYAKQARTTTKGKISSTDPTVDGHLKSNILRAGERVSVDHFESRLKGRTFTSFGGEHATSYRGGCVFVDHMSGYLNVELQVGFSATETIRAKQNFEQLAGSHGVTIQSYLADNGTFKAHSFERHIRDSNQMIRYCGVNAHHQNGIAERNIRTVSDRARAMLLHAAIHWKDAVSSSLWPMAVQYAAYQHNHLPNKEGHAPADLFTGTTFPRHKLFQMHTWGCPVYVLDPKLQQGKKLPRWDPRARRGMFVGFSSVHSSDVPLILNLQTGHISPQFHVVFDDDFSTVSSLGTDDAIPDFWQKLSLAWDDASPSIVTRIPIESDSSIEIEDVWLPPDELEEKRRFENASSRIRQVTIDPSSTVTPVLGPSSSLPSSDSSAPSVPAPSSHSTPSPAPAPSVAPSGAPAPLRRSGRAPKLRQPFNVHTVSEKSYESFTPSANFGCEFSHEYNLLGQPAPVTECNLAVQDQLTTDTRAQTSSITDQILIDDVLLHQADSSVDLTTGQPNDMDHRAYAAKHKTKIDPDMPSFDMASKSAERLQWLEAMKKELRTLLKQQTWTELDRTTVTKSGTKSRILPGTWAFKLKRRPDGTPLKFKARYCVRGDLQTAGVDYFETYAPVVQWSTVRLILTHTLVNGWTTKQVDYTNAFAQAELAEDVYIERPRGFPRYDKRDTVFKLNKSLYGLKQAPKSFYDKLRAGLEQRGFTRSEVDHCLFLKRDMMVVVYVDDTIICGPDSKEIEKLIVDLGVSDDEHREVFELRDEGNVGDFLGIRIEKQGDSYLLTQTGLTEKVIRAACMEECNGKPTPANEEPLGKDVDGDPFTEEWKYSEVVGMLLYLANNSRPDIAYAVHQCARFTHDPRASHAEGVKRIIRYLQGTKDKGILLRPDGSQGVDCYVDADFAGLWKSEDSQDPVSVKSRTGYLITFLGCPLSWSSKLQTQIALSTMEAEYIALSTALREVIAIREILLEIKGIVLKDSKVQSNYTFFAKTFGQDRLKPTVVHEDNNACLQFAMMPKMNPRTKHIAIPYHFFRKYIVDKDILVKAIGTDDQLADQFTKGLGKIKFERARKKLMGW